MQAECKDLVTRHYLYRLLTVMVLAQAQLPVEYLDADKLDSLDSLWSTVWETSLRYLISIYSPHQQYILHTNKFYRSVGLNQNEEATHKLLQVMLHCKKSPQPMSLLSIYTSGVLNISVSSVETLNVLCQTITLPETIANGSDTSVRKYLIKFVLGLNTEKLSSTVVFSEKISAQVLTGLLAKSWPYMNNFTINEDINREYTSIEESYILSSFEGGLVIDKPQEKVQKNQPENTSNCLIHSDTFSVLKCILQTFCEQLCETQYSSSSEILDLINGIILILNVMSELMNCQILTEHTLLEFVDVERLFNHLHSVINIHIYNADVQVLKQLELLFSLKVCEPVSALVRQVMTVEFLKIFFGLLNADSVDGIGKILFFS